MNKEINANAPIDKSGRTAGISPKHVSLHVLKKEDVSVMFRLIQSAMLCEFI